MVRLVSAYALDRFGDAINRTFVRLPWWLTSTQYATHANKSSSIRYSEKRIRQHMQNPTAHTHPHTHTHFTYLTCVLGSDSNQKKKTIDILTDAVCKIAYGKRARTPMTFIAGRMTLGTTGDVHGMKQRLLLNGRRQCAIFVVVYVPTKVAHNSAVSYI